MPAPFFQIVGHVFTAVHTCQHDHEVASALVGQGLEQDRLNYGAELVDRGVALPDRRVEEVGDERIVEHGVHTSAAEVEMWMQTVNFKLKKALDDPALIAQAGGEELHSHSHTVEVVAKALRMLGTLRTHPTVHEKLGTGRAVRDDLIRGNTLLEKLYDAGQDLMEAGAANDPSAAVFEDIRQFCRDGVAWLEELDAVAGKFGDRPELLGKLGFVPDGVGLPAGGTGYSITLHERSERRPPDPDEVVRPDPSWTIGRQGQNKENMGKGWVDPSFE